MNTTFTIKTWAEDDRPREKFILKGRKALSDAELLAILIGSGTREKTALELSKELLESAGNDLGTFSKSSLENLCRHKGIGEAKAVTILAAMEIARRKRKTSLPKRIKVEASRTVYEYLKPVYEDLQVEEFHVLLLNRANEILKSVQISQGGITGTTVDARLIFRAGIEASASYIILTHNHPSDQLRPSEQDIRLTDSLVLFGKMIDLPVLDHVIFTDNGYFSFADRGMI